MSSDIAICGFGRSGSTLFYNMLRTTLHGYHTYKRENPFFDAKSVKPDSNVCTKNPADVYRADEIMYKFPNTIIIMCIRDPRDVLCSRMRTGGPFKIDADRTMQKIGGEIMYYNRGILAVHDACMRALRWDPFVVKYEDLVDDPESVKWGLVNRYGLTIRGKFRDFYKRDVPRRLRAQMHGVHPVTKERVGVWRKHPKRIREQFNAFPRLFDVVRYWGYEENDEWINK